MLKRIHLLQQYSEMLCSCNKYLQSETEEEESKLYQKVKILKMVSSFCLFNRHETKQIFFDTINFDLLININWSFVECMGINEFPLYVLLWPQNRIVSQCYLHASSAWSRKKTIYVFCRLLSVERRTKLKQYGIEPSPSCCHSLTHSSIEWMRS